jgi:hypothetical protein
MNALDAIFPPDDRRRWLSDLAWNGGDAPRQLDPALRAAGQSRFDEYLRLPYADEVSAFWADFLPATLPRLGQTEARLWTLTCGAVPNRYARLTVGGHVTAQVLYDPDHDTPLFDIMLRRKQAAEALDVALGSEPEVYEISLEDDTVFDLLIGPSKPARGGPEEVVLTVTSADDAFALIDLALPQMRAFHLSLLQSPAPASDLHCWPFVDHILAP